MAPSISDKENLQSINLILWHSPFLFVHPPFFSQVHQDALGVEWTWPNHQDQFTVISPRDPGKRQQNIVIPNLGWYDNEYVPFQLHRNCLDTQGQSLALDELLRPTDLEGPGNITAPQTDADPASCYYFCQIHPRSIYMPYGARKRVGLGRFPVNIAWSLRPCKPISPEDRAIPRSPNDLAEVTAPSVPLAFISAYTIAKWRKDKPVPRRFRAAYPCFSPSSALYQAPFWVIGALIGLAWGHLKYYGDTAHRPGHHVAPLQAHLLTDANTRIPDPDHIYLHTATISHSLLDRLLSPATTPAPCPEAGCHDDQPPMTVRTFRIAYEPYKTFRLRLVDVITSLTPDVPSPAPELSTIPPDNQKEQPTSQPTEMEDPTETHRLEKKRKLSDAGLVDNQAEGGGDALNMLEKKRKLSEAGLVDDQAGGDGEPREDPTASNMLEKKRKLSEAGLVDDQAGGDEEPSTSEQAGKTKRRSLSPPSSDPS